MVKKLICALLLMPVCFGMDAQKSLSDSLQGIDFENPKEFELNRRFQDLTRDQKIQLMKDGLEKEKIETQKQALHSEMDEAIKKLREPSNNTSKPNVEQTSPNKKTKFKFFLNNAGLVLSGATIALIMYKVRDYFIKKNQQKDVAKVA